MISDHAMMLCDKALEFGLSETESMTDQRYRMLFIRKRYFPYIQAANNRSAYHYWRKITCPNNAICTACGGHS